MQLLPSIPMGDPGCRIDASRSSESTSLDVWIDCCYMEPIDAVDSYGIPRRRMEAMRSSAAGLEGLVATCCQCFWSHQFQCGGLWILLQSIRIDQWALEDQSHVCTKDRIGSNGRVLCFKEHSTGSGSLDRETLGPSCISSLMHMQSCCVLTNRSRRFELLLADVGCTHSVGWGDPHIC